VLGGQTPSSTEDELKAENTGIPTVVAARGISSPPASAAEPASLAASRIVAAALSAAQPELPKPEILAAPQPQGAPQTTPKADLSRPTPPAAEPATLAPEPALAAQEQAAAKGRLHVGVFPPTNVWIDGRKRGRSPLSIELRAGRHVVGAGEREPIVRRTVTVRENETEKILLELGNQPAAATDTQEP